MKRMLALLLALWMLVGMVPQALAQEEALYVGKVTGGSLHMRREPSPSAKVVATYKSGTEVEILANDGAWCQVRKGNRTGYMMTQYLKIEPNYPHLGWGVTFDDGKVLNLRTRPDETSEIIYKTMSGASLELCEETGDFYRVRLGGVFGYVEKEKVIPLSGEFALGYSVEEEHDLSDLLKDAPKDVGSPRAMKQETGDFTYSILWPGLGIQAADDQMFAWVQEMKTIFQDDHALHHAGAPGNFTVDYQSLDVDGRYQSIVLFGVYQAGNLKAETVLTLNIDQQTGEILNPEKDFFLSPDRAFFSIETEATALMGVPMDGYTGKPDVSWLQYAVLTPEGLALYLPSGRYLPDSLGTRRLMIGYDQIADTMALESSLIAQYIRVIDPEKPMIALTFDDGPSDETAKILDVLAQYGGKATFCVQGINVEKYAETIKRAVAEGHEIASHTWNHKKLTELSATNVRSQLTRTNDAVREVTGGYEIKVLRPPYGSVNKTVRNICAEMDMVIAHWKVDTLDWETRSASKTYRAIVKGAKNGVIVLCHDLYSSTASAIAQAVPELVEQGYQLVTVSELLSFHKEGAQPGTVYAYLDPENIATGD